MFSKINYEGTKLLCIFGLQFPYSTEILEGNLKRFHVGRFSIDYTVEEATDIYTTKILGIPVSFNLERLNRRARHYRIRNTLTEARKQEILQEEMIPLLGYRINLEHPVTFNEKIHWSKFHIHDPLITTCCDKYAVKAYAAEIIGEEYVLPVLGAWERAEDIDFDALPEQFALKVNWSSGFNIIVPDKSKFDRAAAFKKIKRWLRPEQNSYWSTFNWGYRDMKPIAFAEPYIDQGNGQVYDYKFFFNNGEYRFMLIATDRFGEKAMTDTFFDEHFEPLPFVRGNRLVADPVPAMPKHLEKMLELGRKLAAPFQFVRVDFYEVGDRIYLGEMTFYSGGGMIPFKPEEWDRILGEKIVLTEDLREV